MGSSGAIINGGLLVFEPIGDEYIAHVDMMCTIFNGSTDFIGKKYSALIVVTYQGLPDVITLWL